MLGLCLKKTRPRALTQNLQTDPTGLHNWRHTYIPYRVKRHNYKRGKPPMVTTDNMHQGYIFRVCSVVLVVQCYRFSWCRVHFVCLLYFTEISSWGWGGGGRACCTLLLQLPSVCVRGGGGGGGGAGANEYCRENSYFTLESNQSYIHSNSSGKKERKYSNKPKNTKMYFLFWLTAKHDARAGQSEGWCLQGTAL